MNNLKNYFTSPMKNLENMPSEKTTNVVPVSEEIIVSSTLKDKGKLIVKNMEEVIGSVKKKRKHHRHHHHHKEKAAEHDIANISNTLSMSLSIISPNISHEEHKKQPSPKTTVQSGMKKKENTKEYKSAKENKKDLDRKSRETKGSIRQKEPTVKEEDKQRNKMPVAKLNAFDVMMNARNKIIGSNSPGRNSSPGEEQISEINDEVKVKKAKRKIALEDLAERKGGKKRKLLEESRDEYIEIQMKKRAKRFKKMLTGQKKPQLKSPVGNVELKRKTEEKNISIPIDKSVNEKQLPLESKRGNSRRTDEKRTREKKINSKNIQESFSEKNKSIENDEFLSKLSSPIKKRDSLLGYFEKINSSPSELNSSILETELEEKDDLSKSIYNRPKRSCAGNVCYNYDVAVENHTKKSNSRKKENKSNKKIIKENNEENIETEEEIVMIIDLDNSLNDGNCEEENSSRSIDINRKLAPIFIRSTPKPTVDLAVVKARHDFLMSGCPEEIILEQKKRKENEQKLYENTLKNFLKTSHVKQFTETEEEFLISLRVDPKAANYTFKNEIDLKDGKNSPKKEVFKIQISAYKLGNNKIHLYEPMNEIEHKRNYIKELKKAYGKFPTYRCYNQLREKYKNFKATDTAFNTHQVSESFVLTKTHKHSKFSKSQGSNSDDIEDDLIVTKPLDAPNGELLFTEKYKPLTSEQVLVNLKSINRLKEFLCAWQNGNKPETNMANTSLNEFELTNDSVGSNGNCQFFSVHYNTVVLLGPNSSGKTNAVFALANELNFDVIEVNSSMKRNGKKLIQDLHEATQSHLIYKNEEPNSIKKTKKTCKNNINKKNIRENDICSSSTSSLSSLEMNGNLNQDKLSLILFEDADIVFDEDSGFIDAIYQLTSTSKRPVILTATDSNCPHLLKFINQHAIDFSTQNVLNISKYLSILSLIENCPIDIDDIISLYLYNNCNLRKTLLELQFFIQSGGDRERKDAGNHETKLNSSRENGRRSFDMDDDYKMIQKTDLDINNRKKKSNSENIYIHKALFEFYTVCQNVRSSIPFPINFDIFWRNINEIFQVSQILNPTGHKDEEDKNYSNTKNENEIISMENLANFYENTSIAVNLDRNYEYRDRLCPYLSENISHNLIESSLSIDLRVGKFAYNLFDESTQRETLSNFIMGGNLKGNRNVALDYEPTLRSICRSEKERSIVGRRRSRFYHYLRSICIQDNSFSRDIYEDFCTIFTK